MPTIAVCSWSLHPASPADLVTKVRATGLSAVQLALNPIAEGHWNEHDTVATLAAANIRIISGMMGTIGEDYTTLESIARTGGIRPDATWPANLELAQKIAAIAGRLNLPLLTFHAGFLPHIRGDSERTRMLARLRQLADIFSAHRVAIAFETGQENADTLLDVLHELNHPNAGVNFDPANMILYNMGEPVAALRKLAPFVRQIHIKDATPTATPGTWGAEVPAGTGAVNWPAFFDVVRTTLPTINMSIEREAGEQRITDIQSARKLVEQNLKARPNGAS